MEPVVRAKPDVRHDKIDRPRSQPAPGVDELRICFHRGERRDRGAKHFARCIPGFDEQKCEARKGLGHQPRLERLCTPMIMSKSECPCDSKSACKLSRIARNLLRPLLLVQIVLPRDTTVTRKRYTRSP